MIVRILGTVLLIVLNASIVESVEKQRAYYLGGAMESPEEVYNSTYTEYVSQLDRDIFTNYSRKVRPVVNQNDSITVLIFIHAVHISMNAEQGTMRVHGHMYMTWKDEFLTWDPAKYNGVRTTRAKKWQIWTPDFRVLNTAVGTENDGEISKAAHVIITQKPNRPNIELYPTIDVTVSCFFNFDNFPYDEQECSMVMLPFDQINKVKLTPYGPTTSSSLRLNWIPGGSANPDRMTKEKTRVGDWQFLSMKSSVQYYTSGNYSSKEPTNADVRRRTWSVVFTTVKVRRHMPAYTIIYVLPAIVSVLSTSLPFLMTSIRNALLILLANLVTQLLFLHDFVSTAPRAIGSLPGCVLFYGLVMCWNGIVVLVHLLLFVKPKIQEAALPFTRPILNHYGFDLEDNVIKYGDAPMMFNAQLIVRTLIAVTSFTVFFFLWLFLI